MLLIEDRGPVRWVTIDRPARKNAIPSDGWDQLTEAFRAFEASDQRVLALTGSGDAFCSGADLDDGEGLQTVEARRERLGRVEAAAQALFDLTKPTIAVVNGVAAGAGMNLALGCDLVIGSNEARFAELFVRRGLTVDFGGTWLLPRIVGLQRAKELAFTGRMVDAEEACEIGLMLERVESAGLHERVAEVAEVIAANAPVGLMFAKQNLNASHSSTMSESLAREGVAQVVCLGSGDVMEGIAAFLQKRPPSFSGR